MKTARVVANGDILVHAALYYTAKKEDGGCDFNPYFEYVKPWIEGADLAIEDFEGTINDRHQIGGYPIINGKVMNGQELHDYKIMVLEDFIEGGKLRDKLDDKMKRKVDLSYKEITALVDLKW